MVTPFSALGTNYFLADPLGLMEPLAKGSKGFSQFTNFDFNWGSGNRFFSKDHRSLLIITQPRESGVDYQFSEEMMGWMRRTIPAIAKDAALIREEVGRCRRILDQMAEPSGTTLGEAFQPLVWADLEHDLSDGLGPEDRGRLRFQWPTSACGPMPRRGLVRALRAVVSNALEATPRPGPVQIVARMDQGAWRLEVEDHGTGMAPEVLARVGEPFFSTRS